MQADHGDDRQVGRARRMLAWTLLCVGTLFGLVMPWYFTPYHAAVGVIALTVMAIGPVVLAMLMLRSPDAAKAGTLSLLVLVPVVYMFLPVECGRVQEMRRCERVAHGGQDVAMALRLYAKLNEGAMPPDLATLLATDLEPHVLHRTHGLPAHEEAARVLLPRGVSLGAFLKMDEKSRAQALATDGVFDYFGRGVNERMPAAEGVITFASHAFMTNPRGSESGEDVDARFVAFADGTWRWVKRGEWDGVWERSEAVKAKVAERGWKPGPATRRTRGK